MLLLDIEFVVPSPYRSRNRNCLCDYRRGEAGGKSRRRRSKRSLDLVDRRYGGSRGGGLRDSHVVDLRRMVGS